MKKIKLFIKNIKFLFNNDLSEKNTITVTSHEILDAQKAINAIPRRSVENRKRLEELVKELPDISGLRY